MFVSSVSCAHHGLAAELCQRVSDTCTAMLLGVDRQQSVSMVSSAVNSEHKVTESRYRCRDE